MAKLIPNTHQTPNYYIDAGIMALLSGTEYKCLDFACRKTFGWHKVDEKTGIYSDRIALSQFAEAVGKPEDTVRKSLKNLCMFGLLLRLAENDPRLNYGPLYGMQLDEKKINWKALERRKAKKRESDIARTEKARKASADKALLSDNPTLSDTTTPLMPDTTTPSLSDRVTPPPVGQGTQNLINDTTQKLGADAPARPENINPNTGRRTDAKVLGDSLDGILAFAAIGNQVEGQQGVPVKVLSVIATYPIDCQPGVQMMYSRFKLTPPEKPKTGKGDYADWIKGVRDVLTLCADYQVSLADGFDEFYKVWNANPFTFDRPGSMLKTMKSALARRKTRGVCNRASATEIITPFTQSAENWTPYKRPTLGKFETGEK